MVRKSYTYRTSKRTLPVIWPVTERLSDVEEGLAVRNTVGPRVFAGRFLGDGRLLAIVRACCLALILPLFQAGIAHADGAQWQWMTVTAYCDNGTMADGSWVHNGAAAGGWNLPFGSLIEVSGLGVYMIEDRGSAVGPGHVDLWMGSCGTADYFGRQWRTVRVQRWGWWGV